MLSHPGEERVAYESALRVIGRHLDTEPSYHASIVEAPDGFIVRSQTVRHRAPERLVHFDWPRLHSLTVLHSAARHVRRKQSRHTGLWVNFPSGHEDFFRALGHRLDVEAARSVSIDELSGGLSISYLRSPGLATATWEKCHVIYGPGEIKALLVEAQSRRGTGESLASA